MNHYRPDKWYWIVDGNPARAWSSYAGAWVDTWPADAVTLIASETELSDVLRKYGLALPAPSAQDVKAEAQRRIIALTGATSFEACIIKQMNALMRATELTNKKASGEALTDSERGEALALQSVADAIKGVRQKSNEIELLEPIPANYRDDTHWQ